MGDGKGREADKPGTGDAVEIQPDIWKYTNYRQFLVDFYTERKRSDPTFSLRCFAKKANFPSHGLLKFLMEGKRNLSKKTLVKLMPALDLGSDQAQYFENLVFFNQATTFEEKGFFYRKLVKSPGKSSFRKLAASQLRIFEKWHTIAIREMLNLREFREDPRWISGRLLRKIDQREAFDSLAILLASGLITRTEDGFRAADPDITTEDEIRSFLVTGYHKQMLELAVWAQDSIPASERDISAVCFPVRESDLALLKKQIRLIRKQLRNFAAPDGQGDRVVQINIQMFPLTRGP